jgi:hypothetical protein
MRFWLTGPRILGGLIRAGVSFDREDFRRARKSPPITAEGMLGIFRRMGAT